MYDQPRTGSVPVPVSGADGRLLGLVRAEPNSPEEKQALGCLGAAGGGGREGVGEKELIGAEDEEVAEGRDRTPCGLKAVGQAERRRQRE